MGRRKPRRQPKPWHLRGVACRQADIARATVQGGCEKEVGVQSRQPGEWYAGAARCGPSPGLHPGGDVVVPDVRGVPDEGGDPLVGRQRHRR